MAKLIDFDKKYMAFAAGSLKDLANLKEDELEGALNDSVSRWLATKDADLNGKTPDEYFADLSPGALTNNLLAYCEAGMRPPEPLYRRIAKTRECVPPLLEIAGKRTLSGKARGTAFRLLIDMEADDLTDLAADMLLGEGELANEAADWLKAAGYGAVEPLLIRYEAADEDAQEAILDVLCAYPGVGRTAEILAERLLSRHEKRALHASYAARLGDEALLPPLEALARLSDLTYYDYLEIRNAIEALGGDPGAERQFYGDPDFERLREEPE